jgi:hypothetical protein|tara:strand:+ start:1219 stop:2253 length:1035 start_codon:yes stop_codon:yes gene_type:complete
MGKSNPTPAPDYEPLANASREAAEVQAKLGREQLDFAKEQYDRTAPMLERVANQQMASQSEQMAQARDYYNYQTDTFRPLERGLVADAQRFNTDAYRNQLASKASADAGLAFGQSQAQNQRAMASMGANPNSGRFAGMQQATGLSLAANRANAMTNARTQADQMGYARKLDAVGMGRGLSGASTAAYGGASGAGSMAGQNAQSAGQNYMGNMAIGAGTIGAGQQMQLGGLGNLLNANVNQYINTQDSTLADAGAVAGAAATYFSDQRAKENIVDVGVDQRTALTLYEFNYKEEFGDPKIRYRGVMAQEVELSYPDAVLIRTDGVFNGYKTVDYGMLGIEMKEVA